LKTRIASAAFTLTLAAAALIGAPGRAHPTTGPVVAGNGWKLQAPRITHIDTGAWTIAFHDTTSRTRLTPYATNVAAELTSYLGVKFTVTTNIVPTAVGTCPPSHTISYRWTSKPDPAHPTSSFTGTCDNRRGAAYSAYVYINSDYWAAGSPYPEWLRMNVIWHESGHAVGLNHPDTCPTDTYGVRPLMCADSYKDLRTRRYTHYEAAGFRNLVTNRLYATLAAARTYIARNGTPTAANTP